MGLFSRIAAARTCSFIYRRAGLSTLNEGQKIEYEVVPNKGKESAENLKVK